MGWHEPGRHPLLADAGAVLASGALMYLGTGLHPVGWLSWLFSAPLLLVSLHRSWRRTTGLALVTGLLGTSNLVRYGLVTLSLPAPLVAVLLLAQALLLSAFTLTWRALMRREQPVLAALAAPAAWVLGEWLVSRSPAVGAWLSLSTTQADAHHLLGVTAFTGSWGLSFLVVGVPAVGCALIRVVSTRRGVSLLVVVVGLEIVLTSACAWWVAVHTGGGPLTKVAGVTVPQPYDPVELSSPAGRRLVTRFASEVDRLAAAGATIVVLPEKSFAASSPRGLEPLQAVADERGVVVVVGAVRVRAGRTSNLAIALRPEATRLSYRKRFLVPSYESDFTAGTSSTTFRLHAARWGLAVCKDLDFPSLTRAYAREGTGLIAAPSWDFDSDAWLHSRISVVRGVETGTSVVRVARNGALTVSDPSGRVLAEARTADGGVRSVLVGVRPGGHDTVYDRWGDWFVVLSAALFLAGWARVAARRTRP